MRLPLRFLLFLVLSAGMMLPAFSATSTLPFADGLNTWQEFFTGQFAYIIATLGVVLMFGPLIYAGDMPMLGRVGTSTMMAIGAVVFAVALLSAMYGAGGAVITAPAITPNVVTLPIGTIPLTLPASP